jgi:hypothetical protein
VIVVEAVSVIAPDAVAELNVNVGVPTYACEGATERTPRPNAATATSAIRLKVVFVDICFLSVVDIETFPISALR